MRAGPAAPDRRARTSRGQRRSPPRSPARRGEMHGDQPVPEAGAVLARRARRRSAARGLRPRSARRPRGAAPFAEVAGRQRRSSCAGCYLALRRAVRHPAISDAIGAILIDEHGRSLGAPDVEDVLGLPVLATDPGAHVDRAGRRRRRAADAPARQPRPPAASRAAARRAASATSRRHEPRRPRRRRRATRVARHAAAPPARRAVRSRACSTSGAARPARAHARAKRRLCSRRRPSTSCSTSWSTTSAGSVRSSRCSTTRRSPRSW